MLIKPGRLAEQKTFYTIQYFCCFRGGKGAEAGWPLPSIWNSFQSIHFSFPSFYPTRSTSFTTPMPEEIFFKTVPFPYIGPEYRSEEKRPHCEFFCWRTVRRGTQLPLAQLRQERQWSLFSASIEMDMVFRHRVRTDVCLSVHRCICVEKKNQLDATECFIALMICLTCFGHFYAHHQELETICVLLPPMVWCSAWLLVVGGQVQSSRLWVQEEGCCTMTVMQHPYSWTLSLLPCT